MTDSTPLDGSDASPVSQALTVVPEMSDERREALNLAHGHGFYLFPVEVNGKRPRTGFLWRDGSTTDPAKWSEWFIDPAVNIGLDTGKSGLACIDIDPRSLGVISILDLGRRELLLEATLTVHTRGDGAHLYYREHPHHELRNTAGSLPGAGLLPGIDLRAAGGYVVYPSSEVDGKPWRFIDPGIEIAPAPSWLREPPPPEDDEDGSEPSPIEPTELSDAYVSAAVREEAHQVATAAEGTRNHELNRAAFALGTLIPVSELTEADVFTVLTSAASASGLLSDDGAAQVEKTIRSGVAVGTGNPRTVTA